MAQCYQGFLTRLAVQGLLGGRGVPDQREYLISARENLSKNLVFQYPHITCKFYTMRTKRHLTQGDVIKMSLIARKCTKHMAMG